MCPFSHGVLLAFVICLQFWNMDGSPVSQVQRDDHEEKQTFQSSQLPSHHPLQGTKEGKHINYLSGSEKLVDNAKQTASLGQANRVMFTHEKHRDSDDKNSVSFSLNWFSFQPSLKHKKFDISDDVNSYSKNAPLIRHRQHTQQFVRREHFRKLKAAHLKSCKVCGLKFDHKRSGLSGQRRKPQFDNSRARLSQSQGHKRRSLNLTPIFLPTYRFKSFYHFSRGKRSPKKHKGLKKNKSNKDDLKDKDVNSLKDSVQRNGSLTASGEDRVKTGLSSKQTTAGTQQTLYTVQQAATGPDSSSSSITPQRPSVSEEWTTGHTQGAVKDWGLEVELSESERQGIIDPSVPEMKTNASGLDDEFDVDNDTYLGLDGQPVDITEFLDTLKKKEFQRQLNREAQWAYLCMVLLMCLMMWTIWWLGGLDRCRYRPDDLVRFTDLQPKVSVQEVLQKKRAYLPMFSEPEWEEVLMCNRGNDP